MFVGMLILRSCRKKQELVLEDKAKSRTISQGRRCAAAAEMLSDWNLMVQLFLKVEDLRDHGGTFGCQAKDFSLTDLSRLWVLVTPQGSRGEVVR